MAPVCDPEEDIVAARIQNQEWHICKAQHTHPVRGVSENFTGRGVGKPCVWSSRTMTNSSEDDVQDEEVSDEESLTACGDKAETEEGWDTMSRSKDRWINEISIESGAEMRGEWDEPQQGDANRNDEPGQQEDKAV